MASLPEILRNESVEVIDIDPWGFPNPEGLSAERKRIKPSRSGKNADLWGFPNPEDLFEERTRIIKPSRSRRPQGL
ncbi:hypothetical protein SAMN05192553_103152 [Cyclobacterium xiamenense]|uniref:Uncharacterized protein n=1 Tax=Cyclobacterium xiamenense TaxID=1297121 RepID=A0A1H6XNG2_9BACT|nr:hypothetical protein SAMN05192553_103152 [Cyclobacterium xiamenense]